MKIKDGFMLRKVADSFIVVAVGDRVKEFNGIINLNETSALLWRTLEKDVTESQLVDALLSEYDVDREVAAKDVALFIEKLKEANLLL